MSSPCGRRVRSGRYCRSAGQVASHLHQLREVLRNRPHLLQGRLARLDEIDRTQNSVYIATLRAYFDASGDMVKAAQHLFVHRNTLRYRLRRIQDICGLDLENPEERLVAELQLRLR